MLKKAIYVSLLITTIISLLVGIITKHSFSNDYLDVNKTNSAQVLHYIDNNIVDDAVEDLLSADIIVEAEMIGEQRSLYQATQCTLKITQVYKGDILEGEHIDFFELGFFYKENEDIKLFNITPFNFIQPGKIYIVFANKKDFYPEYENMLEVPQYVAANDSISWFLKDITYPPILSSDKEITYGEIMKYEFLCFSKKQRENINAFKMTVMENIFNDNKRNYNS